MDTFKYRQHTISRICQRCGKQFMARPDQVKAGGGKFCSGSCRSKFTKWKGGRNPSVNGYMRITMPDGSVMLEHRLIAAQMLGRPLHRHECVHHRNGDKMDNRPENLQILTQAEHMKIHGTGRKPRMVWSFKYAHCVQCGTNTRIHQAHGLCSMCYTRWVRSR